MKFNNFILINFLIFAIFGGSNCSGQVVSKTETNSQLIEKNNFVDESYFVYSTLLENDARPGVKLHVIVEDVVIDNGALAGKIKIPTDQVLRNIGLTLPTEYKPAFEDYKLKNKEASKLNNKESLKLSKSFNLQNNYVLITDSDLKTVEGQNPKDYWEAFYRKYPKSGGYVLFSQVGFDAEKKHAFVYMQFYCGSLCADGSYFLLEKENGKWKETKRAMIWAS